MRKFGPKSENHPSVGELCPYCELPFEVGDFTTLVEVAPADEDEANKKEQGRVYTATAKEVHWTCFHFASKLDCAK